MIIQLLQAFHYSSKNTTKDKGIGNKLMIRQSGNKKKQQYLDTEINTAKSQSKQGFTLTAEQ